MARRELKNEIKYKIQLDEDQKRVKEAIYNNQIVVINGRAGSGKSLVAAQTALDLLFKKEVGKIFITRANIVTGRDMGFLPGDIDDKLNPYLEAFKDNLYTCYDKEKIDKHLQLKEIEGMPVSYIRGKTIQDVLVVEEAQNLTKHEMLAILTRLGKHGRIIINGDNDQIDIKTTYTGLSYAIDLAKHLNGIEYFKLKNNHRSDLVGKILDYEYEGANLKEKE
jgi:phosphate starvation-inducible PhoH-like protein